MHIRCPYCQQDLSISHESLTRAECHSCNSGFTIHRPNPTPPQGDTPLVLDHFELVEQMGQGCFGTTWLALDTKQDNAVIVKVLRSGQFTIPEHSDALFRDLKVSTRLKHDGVVQIHEVNRNQDWTYTVHEPVEGRSLREWLENNQLSYRQSANLVATLADVLTHAHNRGVVHGNLKTNNVLLDKISEDENGASTSDEGSDSTRLPFRARVSDFCMQKHDISDLTLSMKGQLVDQLHFVPPEQIPNGRMANVRSDVYSLGAILYRLLAGKDPHTEGNSNLLVRIKSNDVTTIRSIDERIPPELENIVQKCMSRDPDWRYRTTAALASDLRRWLKGETIRMRSQSDWERAWLWAYRRPLIAGATAAVMLFMFMSVFSFIPRWARLDGELAKVRRDYKNTLDELQKTKKRLTEKPNGVAADNNQQIIILTQQRDRFKSELNDARAMLAAGSQQPDLTPQLTALRNENDNLRRDLTQYERQRPSLVELHNENDQLRANLVQTDKRLADLMANANAGSAESSALIAELRAAEHDRDRALANLDREKQSLSITQEDLQSAMAQIAQLRKTQLNMQSGVDQELITRLQETTRERDEAKLKLAEAEGARSAATGRLEILQSQLAGAENSINQMAAQETDYLKEIQQMKGMIAQLRSNSVPEPVVITAEPTVETPRVVEVHQPAEFQPTPSLPSEFHYRISDLIEQVLDREVLFEAGSGRSRRQLLVLGMDYNQSLLQGEVVQRLSDEDYASAQLQLARTFDELGSSDQAVLAYEQSLDIYDKLATRFPGDVRWTRRLALASSRLARSFQRSGDTVQAEELYGRASLLREQVAGMETTVPQYRADHAASLNDLANLLLEVGRVDEAQAIHQKALEMRLDVVSSHPDDIMFQSSLANSYYNLAVLHRTKSTTSSSKENYELAEKTWSQLVARYPSRIDFLMASAEVQNNLGVIALEESKSEEATRYFQNALQVRERLARENPEEPVIQNHLAQAVVNIGILAFTKGEYDTAYNHYDKARRIRESLTQAFPANPEFQSDLATTYSKIAAAYAKMSREEDAVASLDHAIGYQESAIRQGPEVVEYREKLAEHYLILAGVHHKRKHADLAVTTALKSRDVQPTSPEVLYSVACQIAKSASLRARLDEGTVDYADKAVQVLEEAIAAGYEDVRDLKGEPRLSSIRNHPGFIELTSRVVAGGLPVGN